MPTPLASASLDHVVIVVDDLDTAIADFEALGFAVQRGGRTGPVHNALIYLSDGTYLELTSPVSRAVRALFRGLLAVGALGVFERLKPGLMHRFYAWFGGPVGLRDWCVRVPGLEAGLREAEAAGVAVTGPRDFQRIRPDGKVARWRLAAPLDRREPFWIEDVSPVELRVPWTEHCAHPNGAVGIHALVLSTSPRGGLAGIPLRLEPEAGLRLELFTRGESRGRLPLEQTSGAWIELVDGTEGT